MVGTSGYQNGPTTSAQFFSPNGIAINPSNGNIIVADTYNNAIRLINTTSNIVSTLAGIPGTIGYLDGPATSAEFNNPYGVAIDPSNGNIMVVDTYNNVISLINTTSNIVSTLAGVAGSAGYLDGPATSAEFNEPYGVAIDSSNGNVIVADTFNSVIRLINVTSNIVSTLAGVAGSAGYLDGPATSAEFNYPYGVTIDPSNGNVIVADTSNSVIRLINVTSNIVSTLAGAAGAAGYLDGPTTSAEFYYPYGVTIDPSNRNVIVADTFNSAIRLINVTSNIVSTLAGVGGSGGYQNGLTYIAQFNHPYGIAIDPSYGNLFIADTNSNLIRFSEYIRMFS